MKNSLTNESDYLNALFKTAQYLATLITYQDFWVYIKELIKDFYNVDFFYFYECGYDGKIFKLQKNFSNNQFSEKIFEQIKELLAQVMDSGFIASELINIPESYAIVLLPITKIKKIMGIMVIGHQRNELLPKYLLNIYLSLARLLSTTIDNLYMIEELKNSEEGYRNLFESNLDGIVHVDMEENFRDCNRAFLNMVGYTMEEIKALTFQQLTPQRWIKEDELAINQIMEKGYCDEYEKEFIKKDGTHFPVSLKTWLRKDEKGEIEGMWGIIRDITERKKAEDKLRENEERFRTLVSNIPGAVYRSAADEYWTVEFLSDTIKDISGFPPSDFIQNKVRSYASIIHPDDVELVEKMVYSAIDKGEPYIIEYRIINSNGEIVWVYEKGQGIVREDGEILWLDGAIFDITEKKQTEIKLKESEKILKKSEERYRDVVNNQIDIIIQLDSKGKITFINPSGCKTFGLNEKDIIGKDYYGSGIIPIKDTPEATKAKKKLFRPPYRVKFEIYAKTVNGWRWFEMNDRSILDENQRITSIYATGRDITERKLAEEKIKHAYFELDQIFNTSLPMYVVDKNYVIIKVNDTLTSLFQINKDELIGKKCYDVWKGPFCKTPDCSLKQILAGKDKYEYEADKKLRDGRMVSYIASNSPYLNLNGEVIGVIKSFTIITERKKAEEDLRKSREFLSEVTAGVPGLIFQYELDTEGEEKFNFISDGIRELMGVEPEAVLADTKVIWDTYIEDYVPDLVKKIEISVKELTPWHAEYQLRHAKTGELKWVEGLSTPNRLPNGHTIWNGWVRDIIERKKAEKELKATMKDLKRSNAELEQFAYVASHDLQEPLRMVASFTQLLQNRYQDKLDDDANDFINYAVNGATRMQNLISDLLIFSRVGTRAKPFKTTDMNVVLEAVIATFQQIIKETNTTLTYNPLPVIIADESQMIQLLQNLISNAIKFKSEEPPRIHVSGKVKADKWIFSVSDNGIGMNSKYFDRIFVIFQRLHKKDEYGGTGIGLAVCKKIIQRHGGKIWVESELGKGSTFYFSIPKSEAVEIEFLKLK